MNGDGIQYVGEKPKRRQRRWRPPAVPKFIIHSPTELPARGRERAFGLVKWEVVAAALDRGECVSFSVEPADFLDLWRYAAMKLGRPIAVRYSAGHNTLAIYPFGDDAAGDAGEGPNGRDFRNRIRELSARLLIVADALEYVEARGVRGHGRAEALALFVEQRGRSYPAAFDAEQLAGWIESVERNEREGRQ